MSAEPGRSGPGSSGPDVVLDLSRLMSRVLRPTPTGVDRVELTYAQRLLLRIPERLAFGGRFPYGLYGRLDLAAVRRFLAHTSAVWSKGEGIGTRAARTAAARHLAALRPRRIPPPTRPRVFLQVSPHRVERMAGVQAILRREDARLVTMVHDLIPIEHPEYARPDGAGQHRQRMAVIAALASGIIANSAATRDSLLALLGPGGNPPPIAVAHLGTETVPGPAELDPASAGKPYFVCVATIEPRKNHLLLLNVWKRLVEKHGGAAPTLHLVGKRGWENEQVVDMLERCVALQGRVVEHPRMSDRDMGRLLHGAQALLLPSFAEGFGMPVSEALAAGVPVIASDIPALREVGRDAPDYLDPIDGPTWLRAVEDYARADSPRRQQQLDRLADWRAPTWEDHFDTILSLIDSL